MPQTEPFERILSNSDYEAFYDAKFAKGLTYPEIHEQALSGQLTGTPIKVTREYIGELCRKEKARRLGKGPTALAAMTTQDSNAHMRQRLLSLFESEALIIQRQRPGKRDLLRLEQLAKMAIVIARIPGAKDQAPRVAPGSHDPAGRLEVPRGGPTGALIKVLRETMANNGDGPHDGGPSGDAEDAA